MWWERARISFRTTEGFVTFYVRHGQALNTDCHITVTAGPASSPMQINYTSRILGDQQGVAAPANMGCHWLENETAVITWEDMSNNEAEFVIEQSIGDAAHFVPIARVPANTAQWVAEHTVTGPNVYFRANSTR